MNDFRPGGKRRLQQSWSKENEKRNGKGSWIWRHFIGRLGDLLDMGREEEEAGKGSVQVLGFRNGKMVEQFTVIRDKGWERVSRSRGLACFPYAAVKRVVGLQVNRRSETQ